MTEPARRPNLQRVPPHDSQIEGHILGAAMLDTAAADIVASLDPSDFYAPRHATVAEAVADLRATGAPTDAGTVSAELRQRGLLDTVGGVGALIELTADCPATRSAAHWAERIQTMARQRRVLGAAGEVVEALYRGVPVAGLIADMHSAAAELDTAAASSWDPVNLAAVLAGEGTSVEPVALARTDGIMLLYSGKTHALNAESEAGKTWICLAAAAQEITAGRHVVYVDLEADAPDIVGRLLALGAQPAEILERFHYVRPDDALDSTATAKVAALCRAVEPSLAVVDGVTEAIARGGWSSDKADDIARFYAALPRPMALSGAAVVLIDHLVKDREHQGRYAAGSQHKLAGVDGAVYKLEAVVPFARGKAGKSRLVVVKDRHGMIRRHATLGAHQVIAHVHYTPAGDTGLTVALEPPGTEEPAPFVPTLIMARISQLLEATPEHRLSKRAVRTSVRGDNNVIDLAIEQLVVRGYAKPAANGGIEQIRPYVDPASYEPSNDPRPCG